MNVGKVFEVNFKASCPKDVFVYRPPDQAQSFAKANTDSSLRFSRRSPADFFLFDGRKNLFLVLELKSFGTSSCSFEREKTDKGVIHKYQIDSLLQMSQYENVVSGLILDFRSSGNTYFVEINEFKTLTDKIDKKSCNEEDLKTHCPTLLTIGKELKIKNYRYDVDTLLTECKEKFAAEKTYEG